MTENTNPNMHHVTVHKAKKAWYKRFWVWILILIVIGAIAASSGGGKTTTSTSSKGSTSTAAPAKWDIQAAYDKVQTGMTKPQVEAATGKTSADCTSSATQGVGTTEVCEYGSAFSDKGTITVTYSNDAVFSKTKTSY
jgi:hypothetical protein